MASRFLGGLAEGILDYRLKDQEQERELSSFERKQRLLKSMETTDEKDYDRGKIVTRDGNGNVKRERPMTNSEIKEYRLKMRNSVADTESSEAVSSINKKRLDSYDEDRKFEMDDKAMGRQIQRAQLANTQASTSSLIEDRNQRRADREEEKASAAGAFAAEEIAKFSDDIRSLPGAEKNGPALSNAVRKAQVAIDFVVNDPNKTTAQKKVTIKKMVESLKAEFPTYRAVPRATAASLDTVGVTPLPK